MREHNHQTFGMRVIGSYCDIQIPVHGCNSQASTGGEKLHLAGGVQPRWHHRPMKKLWLVNMHLHRPAKELMHRIECVPRGAPEHITGPPGDCIMCSPARHLHITAAVAPSSLGDAAIEQMCWVIQLQDEHTTRTQ